MIDLENISLEEYKKVLDELHGCLLKIALEVKRICEKNHIGYFLLAGSLLGAVRHRGFIPWDEDLDMGMLREDYERFIRICPQELGEEFELINYETEKNFGLPYSKIQLKNTTLIENYAPEYTCGNGIFIDVGPVDRIPDSEFKKKVLGIKTLFLRYAMIKKCGYEESTPEITMKKRIGRLYSRLHTKKYLIRKTERLVTKYNSKDTKMYYVTGSSYHYGKEAFPVELVTGDLPEYEFEGVMLKGPKHPEIILEMLYGDYMKLPPEDKRYNRHGIVAIDFYNRAK